MIEAKYTMLYKDWLSHINPPDLGQIIRQPNQAKLRTTFISILGDSDMALALELELACVFNYYEIGSDEENHDYNYSEFANFLTNVCREYADYYKELINNYEKEYDYALNNKRVVTKQGALNISGNNTTSNTGSNTDYELPNKVIPENEYRNTPTSITDNTNSGSKTYQNAISRTSTNTTEFNNEFIDLKNKYMNQIRNVYREFAMKFKDCFYQVY